MSQRRLVPVQQHAGAAPPAVEDVRAHGGSPRLRPGSTVARRYRVERLLGTGTRKQVHLARDLALDRAVAVCTLLPEHCDAAEVQRLRGEAALLARLGDHPHVVTVYDLCEAGGAPVVVCQYLPGGSLEQRLVDGPLTVDDSVRAARDVARALAHAHARGTVHRDVKPANVWLDADGAAVLGDVGLAVSEGAFEAETALVGTVAYAAPEQAGGARALPASDVHALGAMLYHLLCGRPPFVGSDAVEVLRHVLEDEPVRPSSLRPGVPADVDALVARMLAKEPEARPDAAQVAAALDALVRTGDSVAAPAPDAFIGRDAELAVLRRMLAGAAEGRGGLVLLDGEAGMGKTRTAVHLAAEAAAAGWVVLPGRCREGDAAPALWPWAQVVRAAARQVGQDRLEELAGPSAPLLAALLPGLGPLPAAPAASVDADVRTLRLFDAVATVLSGLAVDAPVLVVVDDLHWADPASVALLRFLVDAVTGSRVLVVGCVRAAVDAGRGRKAALEPLHAAATTVVRLGGLPPEHSGSLLALLGVRADADVVAALHEQSGGNPFFLGEAVRLLAAERRLLPDGSLLPGVPVVPDGVRAVLQRRLQHVSAGCAGLLRAGAVLGRELRLDVLCATAGVDPDAALAGVDEAAAARLVTSLGTVPPTYRFAHALVREVLYEDLDAAERVRLHERAARALTALATDESAVPAAQVAHHYVRAAAAADPADAVRWSARAGAAAAAAAAHEDAVLHYARAVALLDSAAARGVSVSTSGVPPYGALLLALGDAQCRAGDVDAGRATFSRAASEALLRDDAELLACAALGYGVGLGGFGFVERADGVLLSLLEEALAALPDDDSPLRVRLLSRLATELYFTPFRTRRLQLSEQAVQMADRLQDPAVELVAVYSRTLALLGPDGPDERRRTAERVVRLATFLGEPDMAFRGHCLALASAAELGAPEQALAQAAACARVAAGHRHPVHRWQTAAFDAMRALLAGRFDEGQSLADDAVVLGARANPDMAAVMYGAQTLVAAWLRGALADVVDEVARFADRYPHAPAWRAALAFCYAELGRTEAARAEVEVLADRDFAAVPRDGNYLTTFALLAHVVAALGDTRRASLVEHALRPYQDRTVVIAAGAVVLTSVHLPLGVLRAAVGDVDGALQHLARAQEVHRRWASPPALVWTAYEQVRLLRGRDAPGDREEAEAVLGPALAVARGTGATWHVDRLVTVAGDLPAGVPVTVVLTDVAGSAALTERLGEQAVHALLVEHRRRAARVAAGYGGVALKSLGDGLLLAFSDPTRAVRCAAELRDAATRDGPVVLRVAVHTGPVLREDQSLYGRTMIVAFRLADRASAGELLVSGETRDAVAGAEDLRFDDGRRLRLKGLDERVRVHRLLARDPAQDAANTSSD